QLRDMCSNEGQEKLVAFNGGLLTYNTLGAVQGEDAKKAAFHFRRMNFCSDTGTFVESFSGKFNLRRGDSTIEVLRCSCISDSRTGQTVPCLLLRKFKTKRSTNKYFILLLHTSNKIEHLMSQGETVFYVSLHTPTVLSVPVDFSSIKWIGELAGEGIVVLGSRKALWSEASEGHQFPKSDEVAWGSELIGYSIKNKRTINGACFFPHAYSAFVTCVSICTAEEVGSVLRTSVVAATCRKQLIWFQDGVSKDVCQLPFEEPCEIQRATVGRGSHVWVVSFKASGVCAVWEDSWKVASSWQDVKSLWIDDFLGNGMEQILLVFNASFFSGDCLKTFTITDLGDVNYTSDSSDRKEDVPIDNTLQENYLFTIRALETRLQAGLASLQELQYELLQKDQVLAQSYKALTNLIQGQEYILPNAEEEGLVSLWDEEEMTEQPLDKLVAPAPQDWGCLVEKIWQRVVGDSWVVGVKLKKTSSLLMDDVSLSLLMDQTLISTPLAIQTCSNLLNFIKFSGSFLQCQTEPQAKKRKLEQSRQDVKTDRITEPCSKIGIDLAHTATVVTDLSQLVAFGEIHSAIILHAVKRKEQEGSSNERRALPCGRVSINLEDIASEKYSVRLLNDSKLYTDSAIEDFIAILAAFQRSSFQIVSPNYTLYPLTDWLLGKMQCEPITLCPEYLLCNRLRHLKGSIFNWKLTTAFEGILTIFYRNRSILPQCLQNLIRILPPTCEIKPLNGGSRDSLTDSLAGALEKELLALRNSLSSVTAEAEKDLSLNNKAGKKLGFAAANSLLHSKEMVQQYREEFQKEQELSMLGMSLTVNGSTYRQITEKLTGIQIDSDSATWKLSTSQSAFANP
uniref:FA complementation group B n=1 Tax=Latimeria chalumnae TaxID=7897 RepID=H3A7A2_LATCH